MGDGRFSGKRKIYTKRDSTRHEERRAKRGCRHCSKVKWLGGEGRGGEGWEQRSMGHGVQRGKGLRKTAGLDSAL